MHTTEAGKTTFIHNGDYIGETLILVKKSKIRSLTGPDKGWCHVEVDFEDLKAFVAEYVKFKKIVALESSDISSDEVLGVPPNVA